MRTPILIASLWCSVLCSGASQAQEQTFYSGCVDAQGAPVTALADPTLAVAIDTRIEHGRAVIRYNHGAAPTLGEHGQLFLFAHECARLNLGMAPTGARTHDDARRADCWAADMLVRAQLIRPAALAALQPAFAAGNADWSKLPGPVRRIDLLSCPRHLSPSLQVPALGQDAWNACARDCGDRLYACQRTARAPDDSDCAATHSRCMARCDDHAPN